LSYVLIIKVNRILMVERDPNELSEDELRKLVEVREEDIQEIFRKKEEEAIRKQAELAERAKRWWELQALIEIDGARTVLEDMISRKLVADVVYHKTKPYDTLEKHVGDLVRKRKEYAGAYSLSCSGIEIKQEEPLELLDGLCERGWLVRETVRREKKWVVEEDDDDDSYGIIYEYEVTGPANLAWYTLTQSGERVVNAIREVPELEKLDSYTKIWRNSQRVKGRGLDSRLEIDRSNRSRRQRRW